MRVSFEMTIGHQTSASHLFHKKEESFWNPSLQQTQTRAQRDGTAVLELSHLNFTGIWTLQAIFPAHIQIFLSKLCTYAEKFAFACFALPGIPGYT